MSTPAEYEGEIRACLIEDPDVADERERAAHLAVIAAWQLVNK